MKYILRYPGSNATFNLVKCERMKKSNDEEVSESWTMDEVDDMHLIVRVMHCNGSSWLVAHYGITEILNAPLCLVVEPPQGTVLSVRLRDFSIHARRGETVTGGRQCIRRLFKLTFAEPFEAIAFQCCHNLFLKGMEDPSYFRTDQEDKNANDEDKEEKASEIESEEEEVGVEESEDCRTEQGQVESAARITNFQAADEHTLLDDAYENTQQLLGENDDY